jgi:hypothetical protein
MTRHYKHISRLIVLPALFILFSVPSMAQLTFEGVTFGYEKAKPLADTTPVPIGLLDPDYLFDNGGVAFGSVAAPARAVDAGPVTLEYDASLPDGERLIIEIDGDAIEHSPLYDWALIPTAEYADGDVPGCVTLFGDLVDAHRTAEICEEGYKVIGMNRALENTLLGLRMWQLDILILGPESAELPKWDGEPLLGAGEENPGFMTGLRSYLSFASFNERFTEAQKQFRSYVVNDGPAGVRYRIEDEMLVFDASPYWNFWRLRRDAPEWDETTVSASIREELAEERHNSGTQQHGAALLYSADGFHRSRVERLLGVLKQIDEEAAKRFERKLDILIKNLSPLEVEKLLAKALTRVYGDEVEHLDHYSQELSARHDLLHSLNPVIYDAGRDLQCYSALFRKAKEDDPQAWATFLRQLADVRVHPAIITPTIMMQEKEE